MPKNKIKDFNFLISYYIYFILAISVGIVFNILLSFTTIKFANLLISIIVTTATCVLVFTLGIYLLYKVFYNFENKLEKISNILNFISMLVLFVGISLSLIFNTIDLNGQLVNSLCTTLFSSLLWISNVFVYFSKESLFKDNRGFSFAVGVLLVIFMTMFTKFYNNRIIMILVSALNSLFLIVLLLKITLINKIKLNTTASLFKYFTLFLLTITLNIYLIYLLFWNFDSNANSQDLFMAIAGIYGCLLGGILTLGGVAWTINKSKEDSEIFRKETIKPFFYGTPYFKGPNGDKDSSNPKKFGNVKDGCYFCIGELLNSDKVEFLLKTIICDKNIFNCYEDCYVSKSEMFELYIYSEYYKDNKKPLSIILIIEDIDGNELMYELSLKEMSSMNLVERVTLINKKIN